MPCDPKEWKSSGCSLTLQVAKLSVREIASAEINKKEGEGSALNADYPTMEAGLIAANILGSRGFSYGQDFFFKVARFGEIIFVFRNQAIYEEAKALLKSYVPAEEPAIVEKPLIKCLLDCGAMKLEMYNDTSYLQCQKDPTHRMTLPEWSDLREGGGSREKVIASMQARQATLRAQMK